MGRIMALDIGDVRIGIALSDPMKIIANPFETYKRINTQKDCDYLINLIKEKEVELIVVGLPLSMNGQENPQVTKTKEFIDRLLNGIAIPIKYQDERLTTVSANRMLIDADMRREKRKEVVDKIAATLILSSYLNLNI